MRVIAETHFYRFAVDVAKRRLYLTVRGDWKSQDQVPNVLTDLESALNHLSPGYSCLTDARSFHTLNLASYVLKIQEMNSERGVGKVARVLDKDSLAKFQIEGTGRNVIGDSEAAVRAFDNVIDAEAWLDSDWKRP